MKKETTRPTEQGEKKETTGPVCVCVCVSVCTEEGDCVCVCTEEGDYRTNTQEPWNKHAGTLERRARRINKE